MTEAFKVWPKANSFDRGPAQAEIPIERVAEGVAFVRKQKINSFLLTTLEPFGPAREVDFSFLDELPGLVNFECTVKVSKKSDLVPLFRQKKLKQFGWFGRTVPPIDLSYFPILECLVIKHQETVTGWEALTRLDCLRLSLSGESDLSILKQLKALTSLEVSDSLIESLAGIEQMDALKTVELFNLPKLSDLSALAQCKSLKELNVHNAKRLTDFATLSKSKSLQILNLYTKLDSVDFVPAIKSLKEFFCNAVKTNDLAPLLKAKSLRSLNIQPRTRSQSPSVDDICEALGIS